MNIEVFTTRTIGASIVYGENRRATGEHGCRSYVYLNPVDCAFRGFYVALTERHCFDSCACRCVLSGSRGGREPVSADGRALRQDKHRHKYQQQQQYQQNQVRAENASCTCSLYQQHIIRN